MMRIADRDGPASMSSMVNGWCMEDVWLER
jgi:hypothetical protein